MFVHVVKTFVNREGVFIQTRVEFLPRKYDIISQLRHSYALDPFCVTQLNYVFYPEFEIHSQKGKN